MCTAPFQEEKVLAQNLRELDKDVPSEKAIKSKSAELRTSVSHPDPNISIAFDGLVRWDREMDDFLLDQSWIFAGHACTFAVSIKLESSHRALNVSRALDDFALRQRISLERASNKRFRA